MKVKINTTEASVSSSSSVKPSDVRRKFDMLGRFFEGFDKYIREVYVEDKEIDSKLKEFYLNGDSIVCWLVGSKGVGKSTSIQHCFGSVGHNSVVSNGNLIIPFFFNDYVSGDPIESLICKKINTACSAVDAHAGFTIEDSFICETGQAEFLKFVLQYRADLLQYATDDMLVDKTVAERIRIKLKA